MANSIISAPMVGSALSIAKRLRAKAERKKARKQQILLESQKKSRERRELLEHEKRQKDEENKRVAAAGAKGEIK